MRDVGNVTNAELKRSGHSTISPSEAEVKNNGEIKGFTGVDDPYEEPVAPEITLTTTEYTPEDNARKVIRYLVEKGFLLNELEKGKYELRLQ